MMINPTFWLSLSTRLVTDNMYIYRYTEEIYTPAGVSPDILRPSVELGHIPQTPTSHTFFFSQIEHHSFPSVDRLALLGHSIDAFGRARWYFSSFQPSEPRAVVSVRLGLTPLVTRRGNVQQQQLRKKKVSDLIDKISFFHPAETIDWSTFDSVEFNLGLKK